MRRGAVGVLMFSALAVLAGGQRVLAQEGASGSGAGHPEARQKVVPEAIQEEIALQRAHLRKLREYERKLEIVKIRAQIAKLQKEAGGPLLEGSAQASAILRLEQRIRELESGPRNVSPAAGPSIPRVVSIRHGWATIEFPGGGRIEVRKGSRLPDGSEVSRVLWDGIEIRKNGDKTRVPLQW